MGFFGDFIVLNGRIRIKYFLLSVFVLCLVNMNGNNYSEDGFL